MTEQSFVFGAEANLVGTVTSPAQSKPGKGRMMGLLTNTGVIPRMGPHGLNVRLARRLADMGVATLRFDLSGLGDSRRSSSRQSISEQRIDDTRSAMDFAQANYGFEQFFMVGFCSGGDVAHATALQDSRLRAIVMWDSYVYPTRKAKVRGFAYRLSGLTPKLAAGKVVQRVVSAVSKRDPGQAEQRAEEPKIFGRSSMPARDDFGQRIRTLVDRGVELMFLYSGSDPVYYNYEGQFQDMFSSYGFVDRVAYEYHDRSDHTFMFPHAQEDLVNSVERWLARRVLST